MIPVHPGRIDETRTGLDPSLCPGYRARIWAPLKSSGITFMKQMAATSARVELAQRIKTRVSNMVKQYAETTGMGKQQTVDTVRTSVSRQITAESLQGTRVYKSLIGPKGAMYVLVGIDKEKSRYLVENAIKSSMNNDAAIWQQWRSKLAQDELAKEISKTELHKQ